MNEFTKEELEYINNYIFKGASSIRFDKHESLKDKLQSLIDNYCDHEFSKRLHMVNAHRVNMCDKCGEIEE